MTFSLAEVREITKIAARASSEMLREASSGKLNVPVVRPGVVATEAVEPGGTVILVMDGDVPGNDTHARNTCGKPLFAGERVLVTFAPPHGAFVTHSFTGIVPSCDLAKLDTISSGAEDTILFSSSPTIRHQQGGIELTNDRLHVPVRGVYAVSGRLEWPVWALVTTDRNFYARLAYTNAAGTVQGTIAIHGDNDYDGAQQSVYQNPHHSGFWLDAGQGIILRGFQQTGSNQSVTATLAVTYVSDSTSDVYSP